VNVSTEGLGGFSVGDRRLEVCTCLAPWDGLPATVKTCIRHGSRGLCVVRLHCQLSPCLRRRPGHARVPAVSLPPVLIDLFSESAMGFAGNPLKLGGMVFTPLAAVPGSRVIVAEQLGDGAALVPLKAEAYDVSVIAPVCNDVGQQSMLHTVHWVDVFLVLHHEVADVGGQARAGRPENYSVLL
jgi:hypothetical protein